jgi:phage shock protein C
MNKRLYRCRYDRRLAGVAGGLAEYFELDPTLVRVAWFLSIFVGGIGLFLYVVMAIIVPLEPESAAAHDEANVDAEGHRHASRGDGRGTTFVGLALILFGGLALIGALLPSWADAGQYLVPAFIIGLGAILVAGAIRREPMNS